MEVDYILEKSGWAKLTFTVEGTSLSILASYLTDVLGDLVRSALYLASYGEGVRTLFDTEGAEYLLSVESTENDFLKIILSEQNGEDIIKATCVRMDYLLRIQSIANKVLKEQGAKGYKRKWIEHDFPSAELKLLNKKILQLQRL